MLVLTFLCSALWDRFFKKCYYTNIGKFLSTRSGKGKDPRELVGEGRKSLSRLMILL